MTEWNDEASRPRRASEGVRSALTRRDLLRNASWGGAALAGGSLLAACGGSGSGSKSAGSPAQATGKPVKGGTMRIAITGTGARGKYDPHSSSGGDAVTNFMTGSTFEQLTAIGPRFDLYEVLAEEISPVDPSGKEWTIRLKPDLEFHNGKTVTADDVIFTLNRIQDPKTAAIGQGQVGKIDRMRKRDNRTVTVTLAQPRGWLDLGLGDGLVLPIVPEGFDPMKPIGTGPFRLKSQQTGVSVTLERFPNYHGTPALLDELVVRPVNDSSARLNALLSGQVDAVIGIDAAQGRQVKGNGSLRLYNSPTGLMYPFQMRTDKGPTSDVRIRQALRLCIDREQVVQAAYGGYATVGYDLYAKYDPESPKDLKREQDLEQAKSLVKQSGADVQLELYTVAIGTQQALVLSENAKAAGMTVKVRTVDPTTLFGPNYTSWQFMTGDYYPASRYLTTSSLADAPGASIGTAHFKDDEYDALWIKASRTTDANERKPLVEQLQRILFERGGWIIPAFANELGAYSAKTGGWPERDVTGQGLMRAFGEVGFVSKS